MSTNTSILLLKPDAVDRQLQPFIESTLSVEGLSISRRILFTLSLEDLIDLYPCNRSAAYPITYVFRYALLANRPAEAWIVTGADAINRLVPIKHQLRRRFQVSHINNTLHSPDSPTEFLRQVLRFFGPRDHIDSPIMLLEKQEVHFDYRFAERTACWRLSDLLIDVRSAIASIRSNEYKKKFVQNLAIDDISRTRHGNDLREVVLFRNKLLLHDNLDDPVRFLLDTIPDLDPFDAAIIAFRGMEIGCSVIAICQVDTAQRIATRLTMYGLSVDTFAAE